MPLDVYQYPPHFSPTQQAITLPGTKRPGQSAVYANAAWPGLEPETHGVNVLADVFTSGLTRGGHRDALGHRPRVPHTHPPQLEPRYVWQSYAQIDARRRDLGSALYALFRDGSLGAGDGALPTLGIWMVNRPEWQIIDFAVHLYGLVSVALYDTLGPDAVEYCINHSELTVVFASENHLATLLRSAGTACPKLKWIVSVDPLEPQTRQALDAWASEKGLKILELAELELLGSKNRIEPPKVVPDQIYSICYTSGTTGRPKGAVLTHRGIVAGVAMWCHGVTLEKPDVSGLSFLPLAHIYGRVVELFVIALGGRIGFFCGDTQRLLEDLQILRPNYMPAVPRVVNKIYSGIATAANQPGLRGALLRQAIQAKLQRFRTTGDYKHPFWDRVVFRKVKQIAGGELSGMVCGSAPVAKDPIDTMRIAFSSFILEGYGMTENAASISRSYANDPGASGTVGFPHAFVHVKLVDVPSMGYTADDKPYPRGEVCVQGACCITEYYKDPENTRKLIDEEGWLHTGDVASIDDVGRIRIIDRVKNIMKLAQGEYVGLERVENCYSACPLLLQLYVHGNSLREYLLGIVVPEPAPFAELVARVTGERVAADDLPALERAARDPRVVERVQVELDKEAVKAGLKGFEYVKRIHIELEPFSVDNGLMTPTFKAKRAEVEKKYASVFEHLYSLGFPTRSTRAKL